MAPLFPLSDVPVLNVTAPDTPAEATLLVASTIEPLPELELPPDNKLTEPPS